VPAAAIDHIAGDDLDPLVGRQVMRDGDRVIALLPQGFEPAAVAQLHAVLALGELAQDRVEPELVATLRPLGALRGRPLAAVMGSLDAGDLETGQAGAIKRGVRKIFRRRGGAHRIGDAEAAHELHGTGIEGGGARMVGRSLALLDDQAGYPAQAKVGGERKAHRPGAHDQDGDFGGAGPLCHSCRRDSLGFRAGVNQPAYSCIRAPRQGFRPRAGRGSSGGTAMRCGKKKPRHLAGQD
jgi:hypothetical protein